MEKKYKERLIRLREVKHYIDFCTATIYAKCKNGEFPPKYKRGGSTFWKMSEIQAYIEYGEQWKEHIN